jgi:hypothetical protein
LADLSVWHLIILGIVSIGVIIVEPKGICGLTRPFTEANLIPVGQTPRNANRRLGSSGYLSAQSHRHPPVARLKIKKGPLTTQALEFAISVFYWPDYSFRPRGKTLLSKPDCLARGIENAQRI